MRPRLDRHELGIRLLPLLHRGHSIALGILLLIWTDSGEMTLPLTPITSLPKSLASLLPCCLVRIVSVTYPITILASWLGLP